jgi:hypothetical protein
MGGACSTTREMISRYKILVGKQIAWQDLGIGFEDGDRIHLAQNGG